MSSELIHVVVAVIYDSDAIVVAKRPDHVHKGGFWEFPGGKFEAGESSDDALIRELGEELGITPLEYQPLIKIPYHYPEKSVLLHVWTVSRWYGRLHGREGQRIQRVSLAELSDLEFPEANRAVISACQLPAHYVITPNIFDLEKQCAEFMTNLTRMLDDGVSLMQLRQTSLSGSDYVALAKVVIPRCHSKQCRVLLNSKPDLALQLGADGVHLNRYRLQSLVDRPLGKEFLVAASCHNEQELSQAGLLQADFAIVGPINMTVTHPGHEGIGWERFGQLVANMAMPVYAIGGMSSVDIATARCWGGQGIATITASWY